MHKNQVVPLRTMRQHPSICFIDLFAGCGGLSEGFVQAGYEPIAHVEMDKAACNTLKTRAVYHWLREKRKLSLYRDYLNGDMSRDELYNLVPTDILNAVVHATIGDATLSHIFKRIDGRLSERSVDLVVGGPPCQAYSLIGRAKDENHMVGDSRNYLFKYYAKFLARYRPRAFVFENVLGLLSAKDESGIRYFDMMREAFAALGYQTAYRVIDADCFGVPQSRRRIILVGRSDVNVPWFPDLKPSPYAFTARNMMSGLPPLRAGESSPPFRSTGKPSQALLQTRVFDKSMPIAQHMARPHRKEDLEIYRLAVEMWGRHHRRMSYLDLPERLQSHQNRSSFLDRFKVVIPGRRCCHTVVAHIARDGHYYIHPDAKQNRSLSIREAARFQTFPDNFYFEGTTERSFRTAAFRQIGNAVPVLLAYRIATQLKEIWR